MVQWGPVKCVSREALDTDRGAGAQGKALAPPAATQCDRRIFILEFGVSPCSPPPDSAQQARTLFVGCQDSRGTETQRTNKFFRHFSVDLHNPICGIF